MRFDVKKFLFIGIDEERDAFFQRAQDAGIIHFIEPTNTVKEVPQEILNYGMAIRILRGLPAMEQEELKEYVLADGLVDKILQLHNQLEKQEEEQRILKLEIERIAIFGDFSPNDIAYIENEGHRKVQFFFGRHGIGEEHPLPDEVFYVGSDHNLDYFVSINPRPVHYEKLIEMRINRPVGELRQRMRALTKEIHQTEQRLKTYAKYNTFLHHALVNKFNRYDLHSAKNAVQLQMEGNLFAIEGWVSVNNMSKLEELVKDLKVYVEEIAIEPTDAIPTYLDNEGLPRVGEDLVRIYDTPSITDKDPSIWVLVAFSLFFAFIVGDGGYGLIFLLTALYLRYKFPALGGLKLRMWKLLLILGAACVGWGILTNSFFGFEFPPNSYMRKVSLLNWLVEKKVEYMIAHQDSAWQSWVKQYPQLKGVTDASEFIQKASTIKEGHTNYELLHKISDNIMMELALLIGSIHVILSMFRYIRRTWSFAGWILFIIGAYLYFPYYLDATSIIYALFNLNPAKTAESGLYLLFGGLGLAVVLAFIQHKWLGILEAMTSIQIFSDILSYLRLYALGLAGAIVTTVINEAAVSINIVFAIILVIAAHLVNMAMAVMSGVIHGLRLNFLEWYHYSFEGGGRMFKPLAKKKIE